MTENYISGERTVPLSSMCCLQEVNKYMQGINTTPGFIDVPYVKRLPVTKE